MNLLRISEIFCEKTKILNVETSYIKENNKLEYNVIACNDKFGKIKISFSTAFDMDGISLTPYFKLKYIEGVAPITSYEAKFTQQIPLVDGSYFKIELI